MSNNRGDGVVIGDMGIDTEYEGYDLPKNIELPEDEIPGICEHGFLTYEGCNICGGAITDEYKKLLKTPRRR
ncbi:MAG: hypothetical protein PHQ18_05735 [Patescibacteria group bacterium]|nr:hypothetical protein [Patescibacteria group bacterium]